jgi:hypothetical protein
MLLFAECVIPSFVRWCNSLPVAVGSYGRFSGPFILFANI